MRTVIFSEAIRLQAFLTETGTFHNKITFEFNFPSEVILTTIFIEKNCTKLMCTCIHGSVNYDALCSHKLAISFFLFKKQMKRLGVKWQQ